ncbi:tripartite tricarboxylate transporter substrate binding protein [Neoroseomonas oryzicola]|uniref:Tripartite tricarboxylate transporter substrate binding protein n=1 Tax=Neoroseomonas oryzicola TaxID=535904 RepID=A0A9X9WJU5_9PROT|nr:tripartite tricarboxylate transporter substrate binding protein [Neoroseomonas oryzicola]MBR0660605.1 tripartite tricarboxylate transporter substrate binding protein [Neoroseomonas oryzicola]NKE16868.1 tripartite tricarboxylate transporter substrate binding protein [Neoroseomonas oryzicola]
MSITRRGLGAASLALPGLIAAGRARAQAAWPSRAVRIIVPYTPGGVSDITARLLSDPLATAWGQPVPVENRAGADGVIGTEAVARSPADGYTLGLVSVGHPVNAAFYRLPFDTMRDFTFVTQTTSTPLVLCAPRAFAPNTPAELVDYAKRNPGVTFAGTGGVVRLAPVLFAQRTGITLEYVPYRGSTQAHPDLMANRVNIMFDTVPAALPHIQSGALKAIATTGARRSAQLPDVPTIGEAFLPGFEASTWGMIIAPANLPAPVLAKLNTDIRAALQNATVVDRHKTLGAEIVSNSPDEMRAFVQAEMEKWGAAARAAGIQPQ